MITFNTRHPRTLWLIFPLIAASLLLAACQEDSRASKTSTVQASEMADSRLDTAEDDLLGALGQNDDSESGQNEESEPEAPAPKELRWTAPLTREDGSSLALGDIAEYKVYYRLRHQEDYEIIHIESPETTRLPLAEMAPGAYEFAITTVDSEGLESRRSTPVTVDLI